MLRLLDPAANGRAFAAALRTGWRHRELLLELTRREIFDRYLGQVIGGAWALLHPLLTSGLHCLLFTVVFPSRLGGEASPWQAVLYLAIGLAVWLASAEVLNRAVEAMTGNAALVRQVAFPLEVLPMRAVASVTLSFLVGLGVALLLAVLVRPPSLLGLLVLLPLAVLLHAALLFGLAYLLATLGSFLRDTREVVGFVAGVGLFVAPVLYVPEVVERMPALLRGLMLVNPFSHVIATYRDALFQGGVTAPVSWLVSAGLAATLLTLGYRAFAWAKPHFAEQV